MATFEEKVAAGRQPCCIPGCRRTFKPDGSRETICGVHWRLAPKSWRRIHVRARKAAEAARQKYVAMSRSLDEAAFKAASDAYLAQWNRADRLWDRIKRKITEKVVGL